jgi:hypothetical protein
MSKFKLEAVAIQVITTEDGKEFNNMEAAVAHQNLLDAAAVITGPVQSFLNANNMIDRNRKQKQTIIEAAFAFLVAQGVDLSGVATIERTVEDTPAATKVDVVADAPAADAPADAPADDTDDGELF